KSKSKSKSKSNSKSKSSKKRKQPSPKCCDEDCFANCHSPNESLPTILPDKPIFSLSENWKDKRKTSQKFNKKYFLLEQSLPIHLKLFVKYFLAFDVMFPLACLKKGGGRERRRMFYSFILFVYNIYIYKQFKKSSEGFSFWQKCTKESESLGEHRLLSNIALMLNACHIKFAWPPNSEALPLTCSTDVGTLQSFGIARYYEFNESANLRIFFRGKLSNALQLRCRAASISPYLREHLSRDRHKFCDLSWLDGEETHLHKLIAFLEHHMDEPMPMLQTPLRSNNLRKLMPKWYANFAYSLDRKDCIIMILIGNGLLIAPLVHLACIANKKSFLYFFSLSLFQ
ncbi:hypothetical protein RFI_20451, partial [Reticulomyxa filosa]